MEPVAAIDRQMLQHVWQELDYRIDIAVSPRLDISSTCKVGQKLSVFLPLLTHSPSRDHPGYCTQMLEVLEGPINYPVYRKCGYSIKPGLSQDPLISDHSVQDTKRD